MLKFVKPCRTKPKLSIFKKNMRIYFFLLVLYSFKVQAQPTPVKLIGNYNLGFENVSDEKAVFPGVWRRFNWFTNYTVMLDSVEKHSGKNALYLGTDSTTTGTSSFAAMSYTLPAKYQGKEVELKAYLKLKDVSEYISLFIRVNNASKESIAFATLQNKQIHGTLDWQQYSIKLRIPEFADSIFLGPLLSGPGKLWVDDVQILFDGKDLSKAPTKRGYDPNAPRCTAMAAIPLFQEESN